MLSSNQHVNWLNSLIFHQGNAYRITINEVCSYNKAWRAIYLYPASTDLNNFLTA